MKLLLAQSAPASQAPVPTTSDDRATSFRPVEGGQMRSGEKLLVEAYAAIWLVLFILVLMTFRRQRQLDRRIQALEAAVDKARRQSAEGA